MPKIIYPEPQVQHQPNTQRARILDCLSVDTAKQVKNICARTGFNNKAVSRCLCNLVKVGTVLCRKTENGNNEYWLNPRAQIPRGFVKVKDGNCYVNLPPTYNMTITGDGWHKLAMIKRLRDRLIAEHHAILDLVIADYKSTLHAQAANDLNDCPDDD